MTIINHGYRFVFVHIPKNAGTSVAHYLAQLSSYRDQEIGATELGEALAPEYRKRFRLHKHSTFAEIEERTGGTIGGYRSLAVVRDPVDRVRSIYGFLRQWPGWTELDPAYQRFGAEFASYSDVEAFVASDLFLMPGPDRLFLPQATWLAARSGDAIGVDHVIRFERLEQDMAAVVDALGLPRDGLPVKLPRANISRGGRAQPMRPETLTRIRARYQLDYDLLGPWA